MLSKHLDMRVQSSEVRSMPGRFTWESGEGRGKERGGFKRILLFSKEFLHAKEDL